MTGKDRRVAIVTGAAKGIGYSIAKRLVDDGITVVLTDLDEERLKHAVNSLPSDCIDSVVVDVRSSESVNAMVENVVRKYGKIDILVNNAGILRDTLIENITDMEWDNLINVNLRGAFYCCRAVISHMKENGKGKIVNISSTGGRNGFPFAGVHYSASKAGLLGLTRQLAKQVSKYGINVNAVTPGTTETELLKDRTPEQKANIAKLIPMGRLGEPEEIAAVVSFLISNASDYITGATIDTNGGLYMC